MKAHKQKVTKGPPKPVFNLSVLQKTTKGDNKRFRGDRQLQSPL